MSRSDKGKKCPQRGNAGKRNGMYGKRGVLSPGYGRTGSKHPMYGRTGDKHPMWNKKHSSETRRKLRLAWQHRRKVPVSVETRYKQSVARKGVKRPSISGELAYNYIPDSEICKNLVVLHRRLRKQFGNAQQCDNPLCSGKSKEFDWSNKRHDYRWPIVIEDWQQLCKPCHLKYDIAHNNRVCGYNAYKTKRR